MDIEEIRKNAPDGATHYEICGKNTPYALYIKYRDWEKIGRAHV